MIKEFSVQFELAKQFSSRRDVIARVWRDKVTGDYFSTYIWGGCLRITKPTPYLKFAIDDVLAEQYKKV